MTACTILDPLDDDFKFRFIDVSKNNVENKNKKKKTMYDLNIVLKFLCDYGKKREN